ncbi:MAG: Phosphoglycerate mutase [Frankiales bacterium]|jgi:broad specificity phosphatase PhoE|nr:Phosphoglycerate mutase [Frankiales bacterium]
MAAMGELWLVRHGETPWSLTGQHTGRTDVPLTPHGEVQARELRPRLDRPWSLVLSSPLVRAARTAELAGLHPVLEDRLMEWDYGHAEGRTTKELSEERGGWSAWTDDTLPETPTSVGERAERVLEDAAPALEAGDVCLVGHGHALRILAAVWLGLEPIDGRLLALSPASVSVLGHEHDLPVLRRWNT